MGPSPPLQRVGREGRTQRPLHTARSSPRPRCAGGGEGAREAPQFQLRPSDSPLQVRGPQSRKLVSSWRPAQEELRVPTALVPVPALPPPGWVTKARDLPLWASVSSSANGWDGLEMDAQTPAQVCTQPWFQSRLCPIQAGSPGPVSDLPLWPSVSLSVNEWDGLDVDAQTPARLCTQQVPS